MTEPLARIEAALSRIGAEHEPPVGWEARVLAATVERKRRRWWVFPLPVGAVLAMAVVAILLVSEQTDVQVLISRMESQVPMRGPELIVGDILHIEVSKGDKHRALWIYHREQLVVDCPRSKSCRNEGNKMSIDLPLETVGDYKVVGLAASSPIAAPSGIYNIDIANLDKVDGIKRHVETRTVK